MSDSPEIVLELSLAGMAQTAQQQAAAELAERVRELLRALGIPGTLSLHLRQGEAASAPEMRVNGHPLPGALDSEFGPVGEEAAWRDMAQHWTRLLGDHLDLLLQLPQTEDLMAHLPPPPRRKGIDPLPWPPAPALLLPALQGVVSFGISLAERRKLGQVLAEQADLWERPADLAEHVAGRLAAPCIEIWLPQESFRATTLAWQAQEGPAAFRRLRSQLALEFGFNPPPFLLHPEVSLPAGQFSIQIQHVKGPVHQGLALETVLAQLADEMRRCLARLVLLPQVLAQLEWVDSDLREMVIDRIELPDLVRVLRRRAQLEHGLHRLPLILEEVLDAPFVAAGAVGALALPLD